MDQQQMNTNPGPVHVPPVASDTNGSLAVWPGAFGIFKTSKAAVGFNIKTVLVLVGIALVTTIIISLLFPAQEKTEMIMGTAIQTTEQSPIANILSSLVSAVVGIAMIVTLFAGIRREKISVGGAFSHLTIGLFFKYILATLIVYVAVVLSALALIVPVFFVAPRLTMYAMFLIDKKMGAWESVRASWNATKGHVGKVYGVFGVTVLMALIMVTIIGIPVAIYLIVAYSAAYVLLYLHIVGNTQAEASPPVPVAVPESPVS